MMQKMNNSGQSFTEPAFGTLGGKSVPKVLIGIKHVLVKYPSGRFGR
jgi:hypothetical protein